MAVDHEDNPLAYRKPIFNGKPMPGVRVVRVGGGEREMDVQQLQEPNTIGQSTKVNLAKPMEVTYRIECTSKEEREQTRVWLEFLAVQMEKRSPPSAFDLIDPTIEHNRLKRVVIKKVGAWNVDYKTGLWTVEVVFAEYKKGVKIGGTAVAKDELDRKQEEVNNAIDAQKKSNAAKEKLLNDAANKSKKDAA